MQTQDMFVGAVAAILGSAIILGAALDAAWLLERRAARFCVDKFGRTAARAFLAVIGVALIAAGVAVAAGWRVNWGP